MHLSALLVESPSAVSTTQQYIQGVLEKTGLSLSISSEIGDALKQLPKDEPANGKLTIIFLGRALENPIAHARRMRRISTSVYFVFLTDGENDELAEQLNSPLAMIGNDWNLLDLAAGNLQSSITDIINSSRQRCLLRTTLNRINVQLSSRSAPAVVSDINRYSVSDRFLANILEYAEDGIVATNNDGIIVAWNNAAEKMFGMSRDQAVGKSLHDLGNDEWRDQLQEMYEHVRMSDSEFSVRELVCKRSDGRLIDVELMLSSVLEESGEPIGISAVVRDITDRKKAEHLLQTSKNRLALAIQVTGLGIYEYAVPIDDDTYQSRRWAEILGYTPEELPVYAERFDWFVERIHENDLNKVTAAYRGFIEGRMKTLDSEMRVLNKLNEWIWVEVYSQAVKRDEHGKATRVLGVMQDISLRKQLEEERRNFEKQLLQTQKLESLGVLAGGIAHDFNNILTGVLGNAELALLKLSPTSPVREFVESIQKSAIRAADLCKQMLAYSGKGRFVIEPLDLNQVIEEITHLLSVSISKKAILNYHLFPNLPAVEADATQVRQVVMNLITNASEAIGNRSGAITISTGVVDCEEEYLKEIFMGDTLEPGVYVYLEISDTGLGMDKETQEKIFDPFFSTKFTGRGLGLAAVLGIIRGHKGAIKVYSEKNRGTTFKILLPSSDKKAVLTAAEALDFENFRGAGKILVMDDEESVRVIVRVALEDVGFDVITANDGVEGLEAFEKLHKDLSLTILDFTMPRLNGEEVFRKMRLINPDVPVILMSGYNEQELTSRFVGKGLAGFVQKPLRPTVLLSKIRAIIDQKRE